MSLVVYHGKDTMAEVNRNDDMDV